MSKVFTAQVTLSIFKQGYATSMLQNCTQSCQILINVQNLFRLCCENKEAGHPWCLLHEEEKTAGIQLKRRMIRLSQLLGTLKLKTYLKTWGNGSCVQIMVSCDTVGQWKLLACRVWTRSSSTLTIVESSARNVSSPERMRQHRVELDIVFCSNMVQNAKKKVTPACLLEHSRTSTGCLWLPRCLQV